VTNIPNAFMTHIKFVLRMGKIKHTFQMWFLRFLIRSKRDQRFIHNILKIKTSHEF